MDLRSSYLFYSFSAGIDFGRQKLTSIHPPPPQAERITRSIVLDLDTEYKTRDVKPMLVYFWLGQQ